MGRSSSKLVETPNNPLQNLQYIETQREQRKLKKQKELKQIAKLQKKQAKKHKHKRKHSAQQRKHSAKNEDGGCGLVGGGADATHDIEGSLNTYSYGYETRREDFNRHIEKKIQNHLNTDLSTFVLNQISLMFQFFASFDSEIASVSEELLARESEFNQNLEEHSILLANPLDAGCAKWLRYKPLHGPDKNNPQLLHTTTMYVVFENIDISRPNDANYDSISPLCKVDMDTEFYKTTPCKEDYFTMLRDIKWKGYVRLKLREDPKVQRSHCHGDDIYTDGSSGYSTTSGYSSKSSTPKNSNITTSNATNADADYDYTYIAHLNTHHPLSELKLYNQRELNAKVLPESCVSSLGNFIESSIEDESDEETEDEDEDDDDYDDDDDGSANNNDNKMNATAYGSDATDNGKCNFKDYETIQAIRMYKIELERRKKLLQQSYLNSSEFMRYFGELMRHKLAKQLRIPTEQCETATYRACSIYTDEYEIIPAIHVAQNAQCWPECAFQFRIRERPMSTNPLTGQKFQWPTRSMIKRIETFGFHVIPIGFAPKRQRNPFRQIEWRIVFPKAERYLEQHLTKTQVKVFMMTKALVKTFVEPQAKDKALMFVMDHLRTHLFWECEQNFTSWPEEFLGEMLVRFIRSFMVRLREKHLRDFFIEERNLFESIPEYSLVTLYSILADITANPLMHLMMTFRNIQFADNFFPKLNVKKLFDNLVENDMLKLKMLAKNARVTISMDAVEDEPLLMFDEGAKGLVGMKQHREKTNGKLRRRTHLMKHHIEVKKKQDYEMKRRSVDSIDLEFLFLRNLTTSQHNQINHGVENLRRTNILEVIIDHLLAMAEKAVSMRTIHLAKLYLAQARKLCKFYHNFGCDLGAKEYLISIQCIDEDVKSVPTIDDCPLVPPALPIRASVEPTKSYQANDFSETAKAPPQSPPGNLYVEVPLKAEVHTQKNSVRLKINENSIVECEERLGNMNLQQQYQQQQQQQQQHHHHHSKLNTVSFAEPRKSIKFTEHVVEVHEGDTHPIQNPVGYSPTGILRCTHAPHAPHKQRSEEMIRSDKDDNESSEQPANNIDNSRDDEIVCELSLESNDLATPLPAAATAAAAASPSSTTTTTTTSLLNKFGSVTGILKATPIADSHVMKTLASSTEKMITTISKEEKRMQLREMIRRKTVQLKGAFNQSTDT